MDNGQRQRWHAIYEKYRKAMDEWPSLLDDPEAHSAASREIHRYTAQLEELMPTSPDPLPPCPAG